MILIIYILIPFTMTYSVHLFQGFRIIQTRMMVLAVIHGLRPNQKLKSTLEGCTDLTHLWGSTLHAHNLFSKPFFQSQSVYIRFTHIVNMQPKFYIGSAMHHTLDREYSRSRKYLQLTNERLVQAELALRYWREHDNLYIWAPIPIYTERADYRSLEMAIIQEWQPRLNYPFICHFFHPKKGILKKPALNTNAQFGLATLWRRAKHKFTPKLVRQILTSERFQNQLELWTIIHALGSNTRARFEQTKMRRSNDGGSHPLLCSPSSGKQHPGAFPHPVTSSNRYVHQIVERKACSTSNGTPCPMVPHSQSPPTIETVPTKVAPPSSCIPSSMPHTIFQDGLHQTCSCSGPTLQSQAGHRGLLHHTTCNVLLQKVGTFQNSCSQSIRSSLGLSRFTTSLTRTRRVGCHCRRLLVEQGISFQKGIPKPAQTWASWLDKGKWLTVHAKFRDLRFQPTSLDRTFQTRHLSHHQIIHHLISKNLQGRYLPFVKTNKPLL